MIRNIHDIPKPAFDSELNTVIVELEKLREKQDMAKHLFVTCQVYKYHNGHLMEKWSPDGIERE